MYGFNHSKIDGNRPLDPMMNRTFKEWWFVSIGPRSRYMSY
jgi:hypothetical protein